MGLTFPTNQGCTHAKTPLRKTGLIIAGARLGTLLTVGGGFLLVRKYDGAGSGIDGQFLTGRGSGQAFSMEGREIS